MSGAEGSRTPGCNPEQTFTACQVLHLLRVQEAETVARMARGYTRLAAAVIGAGNRLGFDDDDPVVLVRRMEAAALSMADDIPAAQQAEVKS